MPDPTPDRITELLESHRSERVTRDGIVTWECWCREPLGSGSDADYIVAATYRAHVASLLAVLVADAQTDALEQVAAQITVEAQAANGHVHERYFSALMDAASYVMKRATELRDSGEGEKLQQQINAPEGEEHAGSDKVVGTHTPHNTPQGNENE